MPLAKLEIDPNGKLVFNGKAMAGRPILIRDHGYISGSIGEIKFDGEGAMMDIGESLAPKGANTYVFGESQVTSGGTKIIYRPVQFYRIKI